MNMVNPSDLFEKKFGRLTLFDWKIIKDKVYYGCRCDCGKEKDIFRNNLLSGNTKSCGCLQHISASDEVIGKTFDRLTVISCARDNKRTMCTCHCTCGNKIIVRRDSLLTGNTKSCGCLSDIDPNDLLGKTFSKLTAIFWNIRGTHIIYSCRCKCGNETTVQRGNLLNGHTKSCGCIRRENSKKIHSTHSRSKTQEYAIWNQMMQRCYNAKNQRYSSYGGRGIIVCERWHKFENFLEDMGERPSKEHSLERIDNNGNYELANCKWATKKEQCRNRRSNHLLTYNGETKLIIEWAELLGLEDYTIYNRLRLGWPVEKVLRRIGK